MGVSSTLEPFPSMWASVFTRLCCLPALRALAVELKEIDICLTGRVVAI